jgi:hypothetical protein
MSIQNRISMFLRGALSVVAIGLLLTTGSVFAQGEDPGLVEKQQPVPGPVSSVEAAGVGPAAVTNFIQDPSFESSFGSQLYWGQGSTNFGTPLCTIAECGNGNGHAGPRSGAVWSWFGGVAATEFASVAQNVNIPKGCGAVLQFYLWIAAEPGSDANDTLSVYIDGAGTPIYQINATQAGAYRSYLPVNIDMSNYADGSVHTISIVSVTSGQIVNFNVDDVLLVVGNCACGAGVPTTYSLDAHQDEPVENMVLGLHGADSAGPLSNAPGGDTTGVFRPSNGALYLKNQNTTGFADIQINYGISGDCPLTGDWDGNGTDTIGIYRNGSFYLRNSNTIGFADLQFTFGTTGGQPIAGDWNNDGVDTVGIYRSPAITFELRNSNSAGAPQMVFALGLPGDIGIAGDWNGDGIDSTGVFRPTNGALYLKNANTTGFADVQINYGIGGDYPVTGDWDGNGTDTIGIYRNGQFYLRNSNTIGFADMVFALGIPGDMPIAGNWDAQP